MLDLNAITGNGVGGQSGPARSANQGDISQKDFLTLMVTQLKNQDPFNPMDSGEFLTQMATITSATGIQDLQQSFGSFATSMSSQQALQAAALVGRDVTVRSAAGYLADDGSLTAVIENDIELQNLSVDIYDDSGTLVRRVELGRQPAGNIDFEWDGQDADGKRLPTGRYYIAASTQMGDNVYALDTLMSAQVQSVTIGSAGAMPTLTLAGLGNISFSDVQQIR